MTQVLVISGDITTDYKVDALVTLINSGRMWFGGVDGAIGRVAGGQYHYQAARNELPDGKVIVAHKTEPHNGCFENVIFVVDDLVQPLNKLLYAALCSARTQGYKTISLPLMRTGTMLGTVEPNLQAVIEQFKIAINKFVDDNDGDLQIYIVVYQDREAMKAFLDNGPIIKE